MNKKNLYCPSCGEEVPVYEYASDRGVELRCSFCGFALEWVAPQEFRPGGLLVVADDAVTMCRMIQDYFKSHQTFDEIKAVNNGGQLLQVLTQLWHQDKHVNLVILDIKMPVLNGAQAAVAIRWIEKGFNLSPPTPLVFISGYRVDDGLKKVMAYCSPSHYINKAIGSRPEDFLERLYQVATRLIQKAKAEPSPG